MAGAVAEGRYDRHIARYKAALAKIICQLFALARIVPGRSLDAGFWTGATMPRFLCRRVLELLKPCESALRRLIILGAHGQEFVPEPAGDVAENDKQCVEKSDAEPPAVPVERLPVFNMFDPVKRFTVRSFDSTEEYELWQAEKAANPLIIPPAKPRLDEINAVPLWRRLQALHDALENFEDYVARFVLWRGRRMAEFENNRPLKGRHGSSLMRRSDPPGFLAKGGDEIHAILRDLDSLAYDSQLPKWRGTG